MTSIPARERRVMHYLGNVGMTGVETFVLTLCAAQKRRGTVPSIACDLEGRDELVASAKAMGVAVHSFPLTERDSRASGAARKIATAVLRARRVGRMGRLLAHEHTDVLHVHPVGVGGLDAFLAAMNARTPYVVTHHATLQWFEPYRSRLSDLTFRLEKRTAGRVVCPYRAARDEMVTHGVPERKAAVVPFCFDPRKFEQSSAPPAATSSEFRLFIVARLYEGKGHVELLQALHALPQLRSRLRLVILGEGPERGAIEAEIRRLELGASVELLGHVANEKVPALVRTANAVVLPSYMPGETFPLSLIEAMAMRLPTIGSRWFGIPDIVADGETGFIVEPRDVSGLARAIDRLVTTPELALQMGEKGYARAMKFFTSDAVAASYEEIYSALRSS